MQDLESGREFEVPGRHGYKCDRGLDDRDRAPGRGRQADDRAAFERGAPRRAEGPDRPQYALILRTEKSVLFVLPWGDRWMIGTTDTDWDYGLDHPAATRGDVEYLLEHANEVLRDPLGSKT